MSAKPASRPKEAIGMLALVFAGVTATFVLVTMPVFVAGMVGAFGWGDREIGWLASADMAGGALASVLILPAIARLNWKRSAGLAILFAVAGNLVSISADSFATLMAIRVSTGFANGIVLAIVFTGLCHSSNPDRYFGIYVFSQLSLQVVLLAVFPGVLAGFGIAGIFALLAAASAASSLLILWFPAGIANQQRASVSGTETAGGTGRIRLPGAWAIVALSAQALYFLAPAAIWGYLEPIGREFALGIGKVGYALSIASIAGIGGAAVVIVMGARFNRIHCMAAGVLASLVAAAMWLFGGAYTTYLLAAALFSFAWNYTFPYQMGVLAQFDDSGSVAVLSLMVQLAGLAFGPMLASFLVGGDGYDGILWASIACYILSFLMFVSANRHRPAISGAARAH